MRATLDSLLSHIAIVDETGAIIEVNKPWRDFAAANPPILTNVCDGANYFKACTNLTKDSAEGAAEFAEGMRAMLAGKLESSEMKYPCHSPHDQRWFIGRVKLFAGNGPVRLVVAHEDITEIKKTEEELQQFQMKLRDLHRQLQNAREEERRRISREIHDELGQNVTAMQIDLAWLKKKIDPAQPALLAKLDAMSRVAESTLATVRRVSAELRPGILDVLGLSAAVDWLVRDFENRNEIQGTLRIEPEEIDVEPNLATDVFRVLQETLTNISRHAQASMVWVTLRQTPDEIHLNVIDNGIGISAEQHLQSVSLGFLGIRERLLSWGGTLSVQGLPGEGTSIRVSIPTEGSRSRNHGCP